MSLIKRIKDWLTIEPHPDEWVCPSCGIKWIGEKCELCGFLKGVDDHPNDGGDEWYQCVGCGDELQYIGEEPKYCPNCRMDKDIWDPSWQQGADES